MKKLSDLEKRNIYTTPADYFENLPGIIQSRTTRKMQEPVRQVSTSWYYAIPVAIAAVVIIWMNTSPIASGTRAERILANVATTDLIAYLDEANITTDELLDNVTLDDDDIEAIEDEVYELNLSTGNADSLLNEI